MTPDEVSRIRPPKKKGHGPNERIVAPGDMLIFVSGCHPIHGRQMLYFQDPVLSKRAAIPPPEKFEAVEDDRVVAQKPLDRTPHVISKAETVVPEGESPMERALWLALERRFQRSSSPDGFIEDLSLDHERRQ